MSEASILKRVPRDWPHREFSRAVKAGTLDWHVQIAGKGPTILLLHGTGSSAHTWSELLPVLSQSATVIAPDLPGHGYTRGATPAALALPRIAAELDALLDALQIPSIDLVVGHSAGAALALQWILRRSFSPRAIVGLNPSIVPPPGLYTNLLAPIVTPIATSLRVTSWLASMGGRANLVDGLLDSTRSKIPAGQRACYARLFSDPAHVHGTMGFMAATDLSALLADAGGLDLPITFVLGSLDHWVPARPLSRVLARNFAGANIVRWDGGHLLHEEQPVRAAEFILEVLARAVGADGDR